MASRWQQTAISALVTIASICTIIPPVRSDVPADNPLISDELCLKTINDVLTQARQSGKFSVSEQDRKIVE